jgi:pimeloyl-ACP methyl ester carboxylesterase
MYDHRGHGRSSRRPPDEWTLDTFADDVVRLCDALGIVKPVVLGQSFGGFVAQRYLARHPKHPARVVLSSTSPHLGLARKLAMFEQLGGPEARRCGRRVLDRPRTPATWAVNYQRLCMHLYNVQPPRRRPTPASAHPSSSTEILFASAGGEQQHDATAARPGRRCSCPVLVMAGETGPRLTPLAGCAAKSPRPFPAPWGRLVTFARTPGTAPGATSPKKRWPCCATLSPGLKADAAAPH